MSASTPLNKLHVETLVDKSLVPATGGTCFILVRVTAPQAAHKADRPALNLGLVIDRSGSMSGEKLDYVKMATDYAVDLLDARDRASLVMYDDEVSLLAASQPMTVERRAELHRLIRPIVTGGSTNLGDGWLMGCKEVSGFMQPQALNRALLLTDGLANVGITDLEELARHAKALRQRGVSTTTLGVGADFDEHMLRAIADAGGGHYYFIENPQQIPQVFQAELNEMLTVVARDVVYTLRAPNGAELVLLNDTYTHTISNAILEVQLGEMASNETREFALRMTLPAVALGSVINITTALRYTLTDPYQAVEDMAEKLWLTAVDAQQYANQPVNTAVHKAALEQLTADAKLKVMSALKARRYEDARRIQKEAAELVSKYMPEQEEARTSIDTLADYDIQYMRTPHMAQKQAQSDFYKTNRTRK